MTSREPTIAKSLGVKNEFDYEISMISLEIDLDSPFIFYEYDENLTDIENIKRKYILKKRGMILSKEKRFDDAILYFKYLTKNSYFENDWYPHRQLVIISTKIKNYELTLDVIRELFLSNIYLDGYQYYWFLNKLRIALEKFPVEDKEVQKWIEYFELNKSFKSPKIHADRIKERDEVIKVQSRNAFEIHEEVYRLEEIGRIYEKHENYEMAISHYLDIISGKYKLNRFYQRLCYCYEKIGDFESELELLNSYFENPTLNKSENYDEWFKNRLKKVNNYLMKEL